MSSPDHSVTMLLSKLRSNNRREFDSAAQKVWCKYSAELLALARVKLSPRVRRREDEYDVLQSVYKSFCFRQQRGDYVLDNRDDLWQLLVTITENKARNAANKHTRRRRDCRREHAGNDSVGIASLVPELKPTPDDALLLIEAVESRLKMLEEPLRKLACWKLEGYTNAEIASPERLGCTVRTVERKLSLIRQVWQDSLE